MIANTHNCFSISLTWSGKYEKFNTFNFKFLRLFSRS